MRTLQESTGESTSGIDRIENKDFTECLGYARKIEAILFDDNNSEQLCRSMHYRSFVILFNQLKNTNLDDTQRELLEAYDERFRLQYLEEKIRGNIIAKQRYCDNIKLYLQEYEAIKGESGLQKLAVDLLLFDSEKSVLEGYIAKYNEQK